MPIQIYAFELIVFFIRLKVVHAGGLLDVSCPHEVTVSQFELPTSLSHIHYLPVRYRIRTVGTATWTISDDVSTGSDIGSADPALGY
jgi:hypothetical protein